MCFGLVLSFIPSALCVEILTHFSPRSSAKVFRAGTIGVEKERRQGNSNGETSERWSFITGKLYFFSIGWVFQRQTQSRAAVLFVENHAAFELNTILGVGVSPASQFVHIYEHSSIYSLYSYMPARKGLIILGNLYLLIGSKRTNGFFSDYANKRRNFHSPSFVSVPREPHSRFGASCVRVGEKTAFLCKTVRLLWWLDGENVIIPCLMCANVRRVALKPMDGVWKMEIFVLSFLRLGFQQKAFLLLK